MAADGQGGATPSVTPDPEADAAGHALVGATAGKVHFVEPGSTPVCGVRCASPLQVRRGGSQDVTCWRCLALDEAGRLLRLDLDDTTVAMLEGLVAGSGMRGSAYVNQLLLEAARRQRAGVPRPLTPSAERSRESRQLGRSTWPKVL